MDSGAGADESDRLSSNEIQQELFKKEAEYFVPLYKVIFS